MSNENENSFIYSWLLLTDHHGMLRGKLLPSKVGQKHESLQVDYSNIFVNDMFDCSVEGNNTKESNIVCRAIGEGVISPWNTNERLYFCNSYWNNQLMNDLCPRSMLTTAIQELNDIGYSMKSGVELEWTLLKNVGNESEQQLHQQSYSMHHYEDPDLYMFQRELLSRTFNYPVNIECYHAESGKNMFEIALEPSDPLTTADSTQLYRLTIKKVAKSHNMTATFAAKPFSDSAGCGMHIHVSLLDNSGKPVLDVLLTSFLAGILYYMSSCLVLLLPNVNSYKRITSGNFWTSSGVSYGIDSRSTSIRIVHIKDSADTTRIELRVPGGDVNPYLALLYCVKSGTWGIKNNLSLTDVGKENEIIEEFPHNLEDATSKFMEMDSPARKLLGDKFVDFYGRSRLHENTISLAQCRVPDWEMRYF